MRTLEDAISAAYMIGQDGCVGHNILKSLLDYTSFQTWLLIGLWSNPSTYFEYGR